MAANLLSSDILEEQFGLTKVEVIYQDAWTRIIRTMAAGSGQILELSYVAFISGGVEAFPDIHKKITGGKSMGKAFREDGVAFKRVTSFAGKQALPESFGRQFGSKDPANIVAVFILAGPDERPYAEILETYSPAVNWPTQIGEITDEQLSRIKLLDDFITGSEDPQAEGGKRSLDSDI